MKPDIIFFGQDLDKLYYDMIRDDRSQCDLFICIGSSMKVRPVSLIPGESLSFEQVFRGILL